MRWFRAHAAEGISLVGEGRVIIPRLQYARGFFQRAIGLIGRRDLPDGEGLCFQRCRSVHTAFMRFPIDVLFLDRQGRIVARVMGLRPWRWAAARAARTVIEVRSGWLDPELVRVGTRCRIGPSAADAGVRGRQSLRPESA